MKRLAIHVGVFLLPLGTSPMNGMLVYRRDTPSITFASTHLYTWVERGTVRVERFAQEHNAARTPSRGGEGIQSVSQVVLKYDF